MRLPVSSLILLLTVSCHATEPSPKIDRIELRSSGWSAIDVEIDSRGRGRYKFSGWPREKSGSFVVAAKQFAALLKQLEPFRLKSERMTEASIKRVIHARCADGTTGVKDAGAFWVHWVGPHYNNHYLFQRGCDPERNREQNDELNAALDSLPLPPALTD